MRKRTKLNLAILAFLLLALVGIYFISARDRGSSFEVERTPAASQNIVPTETQPAAQPAETPVATKPIPTDLDWAMEKYSGKEIIKVNTQEKMVAFTFDAGANADGVDKLLPILADSDIKGTFFLTGKFIEKYPDKVKEIIASGGELGNHTYDHPYLTKLTDTQIKGEIQKTEAALLKLDAKFNPFLRAPYGDRNASVLAAISADGYINIRWTIDSLGWEGTSGGMSKAKVEDKVLKNVVPGAIIMMHMGSNPDDKTHLDSEALPDIIAKLKADGYSFVTLSQLLETQKNS
jgi:peptidoglycan/xylan/chitin deacetylase (PgdA/CDA1 family)